MSLSDKKSEDDSFASWHPLVATNLEKYDREKVSGPNLDDPEIAKAFKALYEREGEGISKTFALLYGPRKEIEKDRLDAQLADDAKTVEMAQTITQDTGPDLETIRNNAYAEGFQKGEAEGYQAGLEDARAMTERLSDILADVEAMWANIVKTYEEKIIRLVGKVAEKVVYGRVDVDNEIITRAILNAFEQIADPVHAIITVNPEDYEYIEVVKEDFFEKIKGLKQVTLVSDPLIHPGGCRIETPSGQVETDIVDRLEVVKQCIIEKSR